MQSFHFYGGVEMVGDVKNLDMEDYMGRDSDTWAFKLLWVMTK